jgi:hypothetical protein
VNLKRIVEAVFKNYARIEEERREFYPPLSQSLYFVNYYGRVAKDEDGQFLFEAGGII